jgi:hypothetical protein
MARGGVLAPNRTPALYWPLREGLKNRAFLEKNGWHGHSHSRGSRSSSLRPVRAENELGRRKFASEVSEEHFHKLFNINVKGALFTMQTGLPLLNDVPPAA